MRHESFSARRRLPNKKDHKRYLTPGGMGPVFAKRVELLVDMWQIVSQLWLVFYIDVRKT
jgi:hypothetical protein